MHPDHVIQAQDYAHICLDMYRAVVERLHPHIKGVEVNYYPYNWYLHFLQAYQFPGYERQTIRKALSQYIHPSQRTREKRAENGKSHVF